MSNETSMFARWRFAPRNGRGSDNAYAIERFKRERNHIGHLAEIFMAGMFLGYLVCLWLTKG